MTEKCLIYTCHQSYISQLTYKLEALPNGSPGQVGHSNLGGIINLAGEGGARHSGFIVIDNYGVGAHLNWCELSNEARPNTARHTHW